MSKEKRLSWKRGDSNIIVAFNEGGEVLGSLKYERVGSWMHWCWYQCVDIRMSPGCLQEVRDMQKELLRVKNLGVEV